MNGPVTHTLRKPESWGDSSSGHFPSASEALPQAHHSWPPARRDPGFASSYTPREVAATGKGRFGATQFLQDKSCGVLLKSLSWELGTGWPPKFPIPMAESFPCSHLATSLHMNALNTGFLCFLDPVCSESPAKSLGRENQVALGVQLICSFLRFFFFFFNKDHFKSLY